MSGDPPLWLSILLSVFGLCVLYLVVIDLTRLAGLRSFTKISSFDFVLTVAMGSMIASAVISPKPPIFVALAALATVYVLQMSVAALRQVSRRFERLVDNEPLLLMTGPEVHGENMRAARLTEDDLRNKLRMAGVTHRDQVMAVIMETSGDVSVLKRDHPEAALDSWLVTQVRGAERLAVADGMSRSKSRHRQERNA